MPEVLAMIRGIERNIITRTAYIAELSDLVESIHPHNQDILTFLDQDSEVPSLFIPFFWVNFHDSAALARLPRQPTVLKVKVPVADRERPGGVGLDDLQDLLHPQDYRLEDGPFAQPPENQSNDPPNTREVDLRVEISSKSFRLTDVEVGKPPNRKFLEFFYTWGGFYTPKADGSEEISDHMRLGQEKYAMVMQRVEEIRGQAKAMAAAQPAERNEPEDLVPPEFPESSASLEEAQAEAIVSQLASPIEHIVTEEWAPTSLAAPLVKTEISGAAGSPLTESLLPAPRSRIMSRRERILAQARENARTPLPAALKETDEEKKAQRKKDREEERAEEERVRLSMRDRLWKLVGGKWV
ncbi:uncharacterized protein FIBRA_05095 [Fibroporia radiculosa]|uniref:Uncharacterized protein n=1 Tax=Fibroporia radiculosa TaxID=599839 RepID=J4GQD7_9APHY|nr:uncharacterized protein FIBRA_05095 [Fibroporia radiculosa]CCM02980.1 predicted protein [Fibroporia radiculosa]